MSVSDSRQAGVQIKAVDMRGLESCAKTVGALLKDWYADEDTGYDELDAAISTQDAAAFLIKFAVAKMASA